MLLRADSANIRRAAEWLRDGQPVAFATETVYGLGADADNSAAVAKVFALKGRPPQRPLSLLIADGQSARHYAHSVPPVAELLMQAFWPGALTLVLPRRAGFAEAAACAQASIGLRCPAHPVALALLNAFAQMGGHGIATPSANRSGAPSPTSAAEVAQSFGENLPLLDGGPCTIGIASSIVDCCGTEPLLLRPGSISAAQLSAVCGQAIRVRP